MDSPPSDSLKRRREDAVLADTLSEFGIKMFQSGLRHQNDGFMRLNEVHRIQLGKLADENLALHKQNIELTIENTYLRRKLDEAKALRTLVSMRHAEFSGGEEDDGSQPSAVPSSDDASSSLDRPSFASIVAPLQFGCQDMKRISWMFQYDAERPIETSDLNRHCPLFKTIDTVRVGDAAKANYVALVQMHQRVACVKITETLSRLVNAGVIKEGTVSVEWAKHFGADTWLDIAAVEETKPCDSQAAILRYMRGWRKRNAVVCCDGQTVRFPFQKVK